MNWSVSRTSGQISAQMTEFARGLGQMFYLHDPSRTSFDSPENVPQFFRNAWPYFIAFIILENIVLYLEKQPTIRLNDGITSLSHGLMQECGRLVFRGGEHAAYIYIYNNYRITDLTWDSPWTWYVALISVDFCYYWVHRACHEVHVLWAQHQVHHSSEEYNLTVGLRQSLLQGWCSFIFYLPMAVAVPPAHFLTHQQFNLVYQFWIHTKTIKTLGPLELIFNTPQHHRVHHGCNLYCIDKNYGGFLIIWDRIFGTFAVERDKEEIVYGLVFNQPSFNPFFLQVFYNKYVVDKYRSMVGFKNKLSAIVKGPSWAPGSPWTGYHEEKLDIRTREKYDVHISFWCNAYLAIHFILIVLGFQNLASLYLTMNPLVVLGFVTYIILSLTTIGMLFDNRPHAAIFELIRCLLFLLYSQRHRPLLNNVFLSSCADVFFAFSALLWILHGLQILQVKNKVLSKKD